MYLGDIDVSKVRDFTSLFEKSRRKDFSGIESWETSHVTTMRKCFCGAVHFNENIESWNVSKVKNMSQMFMATDTFNQPLNKWDTSSVTNMSEMFESATSINPLINGR
nr:BspA family leucine-rich repeat surface protein [Helicobacter japonicus]